MAFKLLKELDKIADDMEFAHAASIVIFELQRRGLLNETYHSFCDRIAANSQKNAKHKAFGEPHAGIARRVQQ